MCKTGAGRAEHLPEGPGWYAAGARKPAGRTGTGDPIHEDPLKPESASSASGRRPAIILPSAVTAASRRHEFRVTVAQALAHGAPAHGAHAAAAAAHEHSAPWRASARNAVLFWSGPALFSVACPASVSGSGGYISARDRTAPGRGGVIHGAAARQGDGRSARPAQFESAAPFPLELSGSSAATADSSFEAAPVPWCADRPFAYGGDADGDAYEREPGGSRAGVPPSDGTSWPVKSARAASDSSRSCSRSRSSCNCQGVRRQRARAITSRLRGG
jgi:hypothetical protein